MKRDYAIKENIRKDAKLKARSNAYALAQIGNSQMSEEAVKHLCRSIVEHERHGIEETEVEGPESYPVSTAQQLLLSRLYGKPTVVEGQVFRALPAEETKVETDNGAQLEIDDMLEKVLFAGGRQIIERLREQESRWRAADCTRPEIGRWVDAHYVPLLLDALALSDEEFDAEYPGDSPVTFEQREALAGAIQLHADDCPRCSVKVASDIEWDEYVDEAFSKINRGPGNYAQRA